MDNLEIVRGAYLNRRNVPILTIYQDILAFNNACVGLLGDCEYVNLLVERDGHNIRVRGCERYDFNAVKWYDTRNGRKYSRKVRSRMMVAQLFDRLGYDIGHKYRLIGQYREDVPELVFDAADPLVYIVVDVEGKKRFEQKFPEDWRESFGIPISGYIGHKINLFEEYAVLDVTLEKVVKIASDQDKEAVERMQELKEKYIKG